MVSGGDVTPSCDFATPMQAAIMTKKWSDVFPDSSFAGTLLIYWERVKLGTGLTAKRRSDGGYGK